MAFGDIGSAQKADAVTPSDTTLVNARALYVGGTGNVAVQMVGDFLEDDTATRTFLSVPAGALLPIAVVRVMAATTATNIMALK